MHFFISTQLKDDAYSKLVEITLATSSTRFMPTAEQIAEKEKLVKFESLKTKVEGLKLPRYYIKFKKIIRLKILIIVKTAFRVVNKATTPENVKAKLTCKYCKNNGHDAQQCRKRIKDKVPY